MVSDVREGIIQELFIPARRIFPRTRIVITEPWETISSDLIDLQKFKNYNKNYAYILTVIDNFTKYAYAFPLKTKTGREVAQNLKIVLEKGHPIKKIHTDEGKEYKNSVVQKLLKQHGVEWYHTFSTVKASIAER